MLKFEVINSKKREMGMTNAQLAEKTGVTLSTLDKITSSANQNPKLSTLQAIARVLASAICVCEKNHKVFLPTRGWIIR